MSKKQNQDSPFVKSTKTQRSPTDQDSKNDYKNNQPRPDTFADTAPIDVTEKRVFPRPIVVKKEPADIEQINNTVTDNMNTKMRIQQVQQHILACVQEFSGENTNRRLDELNRFIETADIVFSTLATAEERAIFDRLIKFRLTGNAYTRISNRKIENYAEYKEVLRGMYMEVHTLEEREKNLYGIKQVYNESLRDYGYRITEALERYKKGYKMKYKLENIDEAYSNHLDANAAQIFKRGLNNNILKEKILTMRAKCVDEILDETEEIEKMLMMMTSPTENNIQAKNQNLQTPKPQITYNYCGRPNQTWDICRTRMYEERRSQEYQQKTRYPVKNQYIQNRGQYQQQTQQQPRYYPTRTQDTNRYMPQQNQTSFQHYTNQNNNAAQQLCGNINSYSQQNNTQNYGNRPEKTVQQYNNYRQPQNENYNMNKPTKYCSHCKTTVGHTFEECRNKLKTSQNYIPQSRNEQQELPDSNIENLFSNMRINTIFAQPPDRHYADNIQEQPLYQENSNGSNRP